MASGDFRQVDAMDGLVSGTGDSSDAMCHVYQEIKTNIRDDYKHVSLTYDHICLLIAISFVRVIISYTIWSFTFFSP